MNSLKKYVFVCYSHIDEKRMRDIADAMAKSGVAAWIDDYIQPGSRWRDELTAAIEGASALVFLLSPYSIQSDVCIQELDFALDHGVPVVAVELEQFEIPARIAFRLGNRQRLAAWNGSREGDQRIAGFVERFIAREAPREISEGAAAAGRTEEGKISVAIVSPDSQATTKTQARLLRLVSRYVAWTGGCFYPIRERSDAGRDDFLVEVDVDLDSSIRISWDVLSTLAQRTIFSHTHAEPSESYLRKETRIADMVAESSLERIRRYQLSSAEHRYRETYWGMILRFDRFQGMDAGLIGHQREGLKSAIEKWPELAPAHAALANLLAWEVANGVASDSQRDAETARNSAYAAIELDHNDPYVLLKCGTAHSRIGDYERGVSLCRRCCEIAPTTASKEALAKSLCFSGQPEEAIEIFRVIVDSLPAGEIFNYGKLAVPLIQSGQLDEALHYARLCTIHLPNDYYGWLLLANLLAFSDIVEARQAWRHVRRLAPDVSIEAMISGTERTYGRTPEQRQLLTAGLKSLAGIQGTSETDPTKH